jgi:hypothetical protein
MPDNQRTSTISSIVPLTSNEYGVELGSIRRNSDNQNVDFNKCSSDEKSNNVSHRFKKILKQFYSMNVEKRGIERISAEDRTDSNVINTGMIWVRNIFI